MTTVVNAPVLVVANEMDVHATAVCSMLRSHFGIHALRIDLAEFPGTTGRYASTEVAPSHDWDRYDLGGVRSIWWRRPARCTVPRSVDPADDRFRQSECDHFVEGLLWSLDAVLINDPGAQYTASRKIVYLR